MPDSANETAFTPAVRVQQDRLGSRQAYARWEESRGFQQTISEELARFISERDSLYLGTAGAEGQPYIQHRGGPRGFLKVIDSRTLAFADFSGNRQYISVGNLSENSKAFIFLTDYENSARFKIWGSAEFIEDDPELLGSLADPGYDAALERAIRFRVEAWDKNCRKHIPTLVPAFHAERARELSDRVAELEQELRALRTERSR